ncbi:MAG: AraC family transcriptional regulator, partial [Anaerolineae bacterium]|nr:AraC family transcriptional regulator [Anaerolineae bacterium]
MENRQRQMAEFADLLEKYALQDGINPTRVEDVSIIRHSTCNQYVPEVYDPCMIIGAQGKKQIYVETTPYDYRAGNLLTVVLPVPATCAVVEATPDKPLLAMLIWFDLNRLMTVLSRLDMIDPVSAKPNADQSSGIFSTTIEAKLL